MKLLRKIGISMGILIATALIAYAFTSLFTSKAASANNTKKTIFEIDLSSGITSAAVGPGDSFAIAPAVYNDATEPMYVFAEVKMPKCSGNFIYTYTVSTDWTKVAETDTSVIYAYGGEEMTVVLPGETTKKLLDGMTMKKIKNCDYALLNDISVGVTAYALGTEDVPEDPEAAWAVCKNVGSLDT